MTCPESPVNDLEINTVPGLSYESNFISAASLAGFDYGDVLLALLHEALSRPRGDIPLPVLTPADLRAQLPDCEGG
jgi:D-alanine-D-alanine ligase